MPFAASFQAVAPIATGALPFGLLIDPPTRATTQTVSERLIPGSNNVVIDVIGKPVTKIKGRAAFGGYQTLKTFEGIVGSSGVLIYSEEPLGINVLWVGLERVGPIVRSDVHICTVEFWLLPSGTLLV